MCVKTCTIGGKAATCCALLMSTVLSLRLDMYFCAEALRDAVVLDGDDLSCGNCLR